MTRDAARCWTRSVASGEFANCAALMLPVLFVSIPLKRAVALARYSSSDMRPSPLVSIFSSMWLKNDGRESGVGAAFCANVAIDSTATGRAVSMASVVVRDMVFSRISDMAVGHDDINAHAAPLLTPLE